VMCPLKRVKSRLHDGAPTFTALPSESFWRKAYVSARAVDASLNRPQNSKMKREYHWIKHPYCHNPIATRGN
jgi:hypothetical protein